MIGFLGDHLRVTLNVAAGDASKTIQLFIKRMPTENPDKVDFIKENNFFKKEALGSKLLNELQTDNDSTPWCVKPLISTDTMIAMPDVRPLGYSAKCPRETLDLEHLLLTAASVARFHAASVNYETNRILQFNQPWKFTQEYPEFLVDLQFGPSKDGRFMRVCSKLTTNLLKTFSKKYNHILDLESELYNLFLLACGSLREYEDTLNVLNHKDLWIANIMFKYEKGEPVNALVVDYQCLQSGPPAFDLMILLYCCTTRSFRERHEIAVLKYYFSVFLENLEEGSKQRLMKLGYDEKEFIRWCEIARMYGSIRMVGLAPLILMDPVSAQQIFNEPNTFKEVFLTDRTKPVLEYCRQNPEYLERVLEAFEEFAERYVDK
ncbi:uncharacterized protein LOC128674900 [Plodia interpunctella]|uniref:uncharacterized protein LOC128674900 n=1 Tax=Plodia interpunctella TaxID=58824 RepID=UPI0023682E02|nr:uncharacterized protein LOC128674900 [Plodia interpunctella]